MPKELIDEAESLLPRLQKTARPFIVEFSGTPKAGKSKVGDTLDHFLRRLKYKVLKPEEGAAKCPISKDDLVAFNAWTISYVLTQILEAVEQRERCDVLILDRGLFDALGWLQWLRMRETISLHELRNLQGFLLVEKWRSLIDLVFLMTTTPETALEREERDKVVIMPGTVMNEATLEKINEAYEAAYLNFKTEFHHIERVDTTGMIPKEAGQWVATVTVDRMRAHLDAGIL